ncbi:BCL2/adenovirus E1B 19 kDa protein-interacting protein 3-like [Anguilla anguilla]|uniref:BCL2/adenovirus E1B 19 kDa protein-interacting protein 3-like n=1 Tax=Anguilla anguilla TaxID=7936 RepID=UPI0015B37458|nr:BCL2/adenovirus E1B 19 kDa protein-interacting protein 3-like [Anguilla anguilla]
MSSDKQSNSDENLQGSWVELHYSSNGSGSPGQAGGQAAGQEQQVHPAAPEGDMERMLLEAQHESGRSSSRGSSHCDSPPRSQTPLQLQRSSEVHTGEKSSSQSEEDFLERRQEIDNLMKRNADWIWDWSSRPENAPPKELLLKHPKRSGTLSIRNTGIMKKGGVFSPEFLKVFLPSLLLSHILAVGLGIYIGRRLTTSAATF